MDSSTDFDLPLHSYVDGFGNAAREYWLGLSILQDLTCGKHNDYGYTGFAADDMCLWELRIDVGDWDGTTANANYDFIYVYNNKYRLEVGSYSGNAGKYEIFQPFHMKYSLVNQFYLSLI